MEEKVSYQRPPKSPTLAGILSFLFPPTGALYNAQFMKFFVYLIIFAGLITIQTTGEGQPFMALILAGFYFYQIFDAIQTAKAINRKAATGEELEEWKVDEFPQAVKSGSVFWGLVLMALGVVFLLGNFEIIDYDHIWKFWPLAVIVIGVKLIADYTKTKNGSEIQA